MTTETQTDSNTDQTSGNSEEPKPIRERDGRGLFVKGNIGGPGRKKRKACENPREMLPQVVRSIIDVACEGGDKGKKWLRSLKNESSVAFVSAMTTLARFADTQAKQEGTMSCPECAARMSIEEASKIMQKLKDNLSQGLDTMQAYAKGLELQVKGLQNEIEVLKQPPPLPVTAEDKQTDQSVGRRARDDDDDDDDDDREEYMARWAPRFGVA